MRRLRVRWFCFQGRRSNGFGGGVVRSRENLNFFTFFGFSSLVQWFSVRLTVLAFYMPGAHRAGSFGIRLESI